MEYGGIYIIHEREFVLSGQNVFKIGCSADFETRSQRYPKGSKLLFWYTCPNHKDAETALKQLLNQTDGIQQCREYGTEYYRCDYQYLVDTVVLFFKANLMDDSDSSESDTDDSLTGRVGAMTISNTVPNAPRATLTPFCDPGVAASGFGTPPPKSSHSQSSVSDTFSSKVSSFQSTGFGQAAAAAPVATHGFQTPAQSTGFGQSTMTPPAATHGFQTPVQSTGFGKAVPAAHCSNTTPAATAVVIHTPAALPHANGNDRIDYVCEFMERWAVAYSTDNGKSYTSGAPPSSLGIVLLRFALTDWGTGTVISVCRKISWEMLHVQYIAFLYYKKFSAGTSTVKEPEYAAMLAHIQRRLKQTKMDKMKLYLYPDKSWVDVITTYYRGVVAGTAGYLSYYEINAKRGNVLQLYAYCNSGKMQALQTEDGRVYGCDQWLTV